MKVWRMYLIDNRDESSRSNDTELKFRIQCLESVGALMAHLIRGKTI